MSKKIKSCEGFTFWEGMKDDVIRVFPMIGAYIPRLLQINGEIYLDIRMFRLNAAGILSPTTSGIRLKYDDMATLRRKIAKIIKLIESIGADNDD
jgi:hypothetical protein